MTIIYYYYARNTYLAHTIVRVCMHAELIVIMGICVHVLAYLVQ